MNNKKELLIVIYGEGIKLNRRGKSQLFVKYRGVFNGEWINIRVTQSVDKKLGGRSGIFTVVVPYDGYEIEGERLHIRSLGSIIYKKQLSNRNYMKYILKKSTNDKGYFSFRLLHDDSFFVTAKLTDEQHRKFDELRDGNYECRTFITDIKYNHKESGILYYNIRNLEILGEVKDDDK